MADFFNRFIDRLLDRPRNQKNSSTFDTKLIEKTKKLSFPVAFFLTRHDRSYNIDRTFHYVGASINLLKSPKVVYKIYINFTDQTLQKKS